MDLKITMEVSVNNLIPGSTPAFLAYFLILQKNTQKKELGWSQRISISTNVISTQITGTLTLISILHSRGVVY